MPLPPAALLGPCEIAESLGTGDMMVPIALSGMSVIRVLDPRAWL